MLAKTHPQQRERINLLYGYGILDTGPEEEFDAITRIAATVCDMPTALVSLVTEDRQWFKARLGCALEETGLDASICSHALLGDGLFEVPDTQLDPRTADNPLCQGEGAFRFYAGAPMIDPTSGLPLGTVCVLDTKPRELTDVQRQVLTDLAAQAMRLISLRKSLIDREIAARETDHRIKNSLQSVASHIRLQVRMLSKAEVVAREALQATEQRLNAIATLHEALCYSGTGDEVDIADYLGRILKLSLSEAPLTIRSQADIAHCMVDAHAAAALGTLVNEMAVNAVRHAFPQGQEGTVRLAGRYLPDGTYELTCADDGIGLPDEPLPREGRRGGLGHAIIEAMLQQLGALDVAPSNAPGGGTQLAVTFRPQTEAETGRGKVAPVANDRRPDAEVGSTAEDAAETAGRIVAEAAAARLPIDGKQVSVILPSGDEGDGEPPAPPRAA
ncbi:histidine kinase dimerization/phosphoacceptor domain -containing protein [Pseudoroseicyclus sp. H15]